MMFTMTMTPTSHDKSMIKDEPLVRHALCFERMDTQVVKPLAIPMRNI